MKKILILLGISCMLFMMTLPVFGDDLDRLKIEDLMTYSEFKASGLTRQTPDEINALNEWLNKFIAGRLKNAAPEEEGEKKSRGLLELFGNPEGVPYKIQKVKKKKLKINNREYEMIRSCEGFEKGDKIKFIKGSAHGLCETATILHMVSSARCDVWCDNY